MKSLHLRLSVMMFIHYFAAGSVLPILSLYLNRYLGFSGAQIGSILAMSSVAAFVSPMAGTVLVDKLLPAERLLALFQFSAAAVMAVLAFQTDYVPVLVCYLFYMLLFGPCVALTNAITFHHASDKSQNFGKVRLWGTIGWISAAWFFAVFSMQGLRIALFISAGAGILLGFYALSIPRSTQSKRAHLFEGKVFLVFTNPQVIALCLMAMLMRMTNQYYYFGAAPYLNNLGIGEGFVMSTMSIGQITEVIFLSLLGIGIAKFGYRKILLLGIIAEGCRFAFFIAGGYLNLSLFGPLGILFHGPSFAFFSATSFILLDTFCDLRSRSGAHQVFEILTHGVGSFLGFQAAGFFFDLFVIDGLSGVPMNYQLFWLVPMVMTVCAFIIALFFGKVNIEK